MTKTVYLGGDIMSHGSNLARQEEYDKFLDAGIDADVYSPVKNKSINDKSNMTEEENNELAEKITEADIGRLWQSDIVVMCPEQNAVGSLCEMGCLYGWKYIAVILHSIIDQCAEEAWDGCTNEDIAVAKFERLLSEYILGMWKKLDNKEIYAHYFDIRTNHLNEKDWRRSFSINQLLYGMILDATTDNTLHNSFDEVLEVLKSHEADKETTDAE